MRVFAAELKKLLILFKADPKSLVACIIAPTIILIVFAFTFGDFTSLKLAYVNEDTGVYGEELESAVFTQISPLGDRPYFEETETDYETAMELYQQGKINGVIIVPETFSADLEDGKNANIDYIFNNYNTDMAKNLRLYLKEGILDFYRSTDSNLQIEVEEVLNVETQLHWFSDDWNHRNHNMDRIGDIDKKILSKILQNHKYHTRTDVGRMYLQYIKVNRTDRTAVYNISAILSSGQTITI